jgi:biopolymer transport protein ExbD
MKIPGRDRGRGLNFDITPLIDIVFLLIIFFLAASHLVRNEAAEAVELPTATQSETDPEETPRRLVITIPADQTLHLGARELTQQELEQALLAEGMGEPNQALEVRIRADKSVPYQVVEPILVACAKAQISKVKFAVLAP